MAFISSVPTMAAVVTPTPKTLAHCSSLIRRNSSTGINKCWAGSRLSVPIKAAAVISTTYDDSSELSRSSFPEGFVFGTGSSNYQYEGAVSEGGRGKGTWDIASHTPGRVKDGKNADIAIDHYHRYKEDVAIMKYMNTDAYRFSISWPRILPNGKLSGGINQEGIRFYNNLIDELLANGQIPYVTLFHWDLPNILQEEYEGFCSPYIINDFKDFVEICFQEFGDRVKHWVTFNEPFSYCLSTSHRYKATHNQLLSHAAVVELYKTKYQDSQNGVIGIGLNSHWFKPYSTDPLDQQATERALDFMFGWFIQPLTTGEYPANMVSFVKDLPKFTEEQSKSLIGSYDFIGINYYTTMYAANATEALILKTKSKSGGAAGVNSVFKSFNVVLTDENHDGTPVGPRAATWLYVCPKGIQDLLLYTKEKYNNPTIIITENGMNEDNDSTLSLEEALMDTNRIDYYYRHLYYVSSAIRRGVNVQGYFAWSLLDNFEWSDGYTVRFGINFVDYENDLKRHPKLSARWFRKFLEKPQN
ncbi:putative beta-glucosidase [Medicago truncatula]|uniref:Cyanogenic beta-glucosidase n=1 Tax=Medicago truncatula TaxID=3880 RepID=G7JN11_MEDTR|nr:beta-glucosidase 24 [Medicago truncatula]AES86837.2 cyanogenic beta-glucosidase, putative [Medicago truncatula]QNT09607.1 cyanogenic beta-glucosidase [Medicago truncatula]RHN58784.1 putative beta-glucosidase [Medicago truncatula]